MSFTHKPEKEICKRFNLGKYIQLLTIPCAMNEINNNANILPNITLGFHIFDSCKMLQRELDGTLRIVTGQSRAIPNYQCRQQEQLAAIIGHSISTYSILMAHILGLARYPQISHVSTSYLLSDKTQFPSFFRTVPSDAHQSRGLAQLVLHFGWTWVGMVADANDYGFQGIQALRQEILKSGACVEFLVYIQSSRPDHNIPPIIQTIKKSKAKVVVVFATESNVIFLFDELIKQNITEKTWVASEAWATSTMFLPEKYWNLLLGTVGFALSSDFSPGFHEFIEHISLPRLSQETWDLMFSEDNLKNAFLECLNFAFQLERMANNSAGEDAVEHFRYHLKNLINLRQMYALYCAVHVIAQTLHDLASCKATNGPFINRSCSNIWSFKPWQVVSSEPSPDMAYGISHYMKKVRVKLSCDITFSFDDNGNPPPVYDIVNWQLSPEGTMRQVKVGRYHSTAANKHVLNINMSNIQWSSDDQVLRTIVEGFRLINHGVPRRSREVKIIVDPSVWLGQVPISVCNKNCSPGLRKAAKKGEPSCCYQCVTCSQGEISNQTDSGECLKCTWNQWPSQDKDRCLPKTIEYLKYEEPLGITLTTTTVTSSFVPLAILGLLISYKATPVVRANNYTISCLLLICLSLCFLCSLAFIGYPQREKCLLRQVAFGTVFALCVSCILAKTIMVAIAFRATRPNSDLKRWAGPHVSCKVISLGTFFQFLICLTWLALFPPFPEYNDKTKPGVLILECNEGSATCFWSTLGYLGVLAVISCVVAFLAKDLPDSFNEAKFITFSMIAFLSVWLSFIPAHLSTSGKYTVALEIFAILSSSWAMLCCMFVPKCYIILFRPTVNTKKHLMRRFSKRTNYNMHS
ncbi:extracellular calcium-sensing receptor-like [Pseudophryne corroboree]|uniref:extracellular calcium-sensing receptor-like n=1 Tax=Pseudophryne corroboree TaxID=495146 RepID=UPI003081536A